MLVASKTAWEADPVPSQTMAARLHVHQSTTVPNGTLGKGPGLIIVVSHVRVHRLRSYTDQGSEPVTRVALTTGRAVLRGACRAHFPPLLTASPSKCDVASGFLRHHLTAHKTSLPVRAH